MPRRAMAGVSRPAMLSPAKAMRPWEARHRPMMVRRQVVLPAPLRPSSTVMPPSGTAKLTPCRMWYWAMWVCTPSSTSRASGTRRLHAEIGLLHDGRGHDLRRHAVGHETAVVQHHDAVRQGADHVHLVLHQQDRPGLVGLERSDEVENHGHLVYAHAGGWLVEHQDAGFERDQH